MTTSSDINIKGLHCADCVAKVERGLLQAPGIITAVLNFSTGKLHIEYDESTITIEEIHAKIRSLGHEVLAGEIEEESLFTLSNRDFVFTIISGVALFSGLIVEHLLGDYITDSLLFEPEWFYNIRISGVLYFIAMFFGGYHRMYGALSGLRNGIFVIDSLMLIGAIGAVLIGEFPEGGAVLFLFSLAELLEDYSVDRSRRSLRELVGLTPDSVLLRRDGQVVEVAAEDVRIGDVALIKPGERIGVDGIVVEGSSPVNQAPITGESMPVDKDPGDTVFAGTINQEGILEVRVEKEAKDSALARIIQMVESAEEHKAETERFVDRFSKYFTPSVLIMAIVVATVPHYVFGQDLHDWVYKSLLLLLISCPCALALSTPISIVSGITTGAKHGILFKGGAHLEKLDTIGTFAFDKTGTLTEGKPAVTDVIPLNGHSRKEVLSIAASLESLSKHPLGNAIVEQATVDHTELQQVNDLVEKAGKGIEGVIQGTGYVVGSPRLFKPEALAALDDPDSSDNVLHRLEDQARTAVLVGTPDRIMGVIGISDRIRDSAKAMVQSLRELGIHHMVMVTGDNERTARAVANEVGIHDYRAGLLPEEKVAVIEDLKRANEVQEQDRSKKTKRLKTTGIAMVGDGVNDAPALVTADLGIAMGAAGSDTALEVADIALMDEDLMKLPELLSLGRKTMAVIRQNIILAIGVKLMFAILVFPGYVTLWMAVAIGDMGISLTVIANALRLTRTTGGFEDTETGRTPSVSPSQDSVCTDSCCSGDGHESYPKEELHDDCDCCSDDPVKEKNDETDDGCSDTPPDVSPVVTEHCECGCSDNDTSTDHGSN